MLIYHIFLIHDNLFGADENVEHNDLDFDNGDENKEPQMNGHDGANAQEEPFDLSQRLTTLSVNDLKVDEPFTY